MKNFRDLLIGDMTGETYNFDIRCSDMYLDSLKGAPAIVDGIFSCGYNNLKSSEFSPRVVKGDFYILTIKPN